MEEGGNIKGDGGSRSFDGKGVAWASFGGAFRPYTPTVSQSSAATGTSKSSSLRVIVRRPVNSPFLGQLICWGRKRSFCLHISVFYCCLLFICN